MRPSVSMFVCLSGSVCIVFRSVYMRVPATKVFYCMNIVARIIAFYIVASLRQHGIGFTLLLRSFRFYYGCICFSFTFFISLFHQLKLLVIALTYTTAFEVLKSYDA